VAVKRIRARVHGRVQGVFFRDYTRREALRLVLNGWVRNLADGSVETECEGNAQQVDQFLAWLAEGSPLSLVAGVEHREIAVIGTESGFDIRY